MPFPQPMPNISLPNPSKSSTLSAEDPASDHHQRPHHAAVMPSAHVIPQTAIDPHAMDADAVESDAIGGTDVVEEWIDHTNEPLGEIGNGYELTSTLQTLCLTNNRISKIDRLEPCVNLTELILRQNSIIAVEGLHTLHNLVELDLYMNAVTEISPNEFAQNPKLERLDLSFNQLRSLDNFPSSNLQNLEELYLIGNKIRKITALHPMPKLTMLELGDNRVREIENLQGLTTLQSLWLGRNKITEIRNLDALTDLRKLSLQSNRITAIQCLSGLARLEELYLSHNGLKSMRGVEQLKNLQLLDLGSNEIDRIEGVETLLQLKEFWFNDNKLPSLDGLQVFRDVGVVETVYLEGNPVARNEDYQRSALSILPDSLEQLDAMLVVDIRKQLEQGGVNHANNTNIPVTNCNLPTAVTEQDEQRT